MMNKSKIATRVTRIAKIATRVKYSAGKHKIISKWTKLLEIKSTMFQITKTGNYVFRFSNTCHRNTVARVVSTLGWRLAFKTRVLL